MFLNKSRNIFQWKIQNIDIRAFPEVIRCTIFTDVMRLPKSCAAALKFLAEAACGADSQVRPAQQPPSEVMLQSNRRWKITPIKVIAL